MQRISKNEYYLNIAKAVSQRSTCLKRKYGCVIVNNDEIIATGYNGSPRGVLNCCDIHNDICPRNNEPHNSGDYSNCPAVHAEQNAMLRASRSEMIGATLYLYGYDNSTKSDINALPCPICMRMIKNSGIKRIMNSEGELKWE